MLNKTNIRIFKLLFFATLILTSFIISPHFALADIAPPGDITNQATATYDDASANNYTSNSNTTTVTVQTVYAVTVNTPVDQSGGASALINYAYTVTNMSNVANTFNLSAASEAAGETWTATLYADDGASPNDGIRDGDENTVIASTGSLAAGANYKFFVEVTIPDSGSNPTTDDTILTVIGTGDATAVDDTSDTVTTTASVPNLSIVKQVRNVTDSGSFANTATADPGDILEYQIAITNDGASSAEVVVLSDTDNANTTYVPGSIWIGSDGTASNGGSNVNEDDNNTGAEDCGLANDTCGHGNDDGSGNITIYAGSNATEIVGGSLAGGGVSTVYVYFQVTVDNTPLP